MSVPHPIQIVKYNRETKSFDLNLPAIQKFIKENHAEDIPLAIVTLNGPMRKGKSFILNFFLKYLNRVYGETDGTRIEERYWLGDDENVELVGFPWRSGSQRHTNGIWIWSKILMNDDENSKRFGVVLMDTQGTFDGNSKSKDDNIIFYLSMMLSSIHVINLSNGINDENLKNLRLLIDFSHLLGEKKQPKPFEKLIYLVRDWNYPYEAEFGFTGGETLINQSLELNAVEDDEELKYVKQNIRSGYKDIKCFLMPMPGSKVSSSSNFTGQLKDISGDFKTHLNMLIPAILSPANIATKKIFGQPLKGRHFESYVKSYWTIFKGGVLRPPHTILGATLNSYLMTSKRDAVEYYQREIQPYIASDKDVIPFGEMVRIHENIYGYAVQNFKDSTIFWDDKIRVNFIEKLQTDLQNLFILYAAANDTKRTNNLSQTITNLIGQANALVAKTEEQEQLLGKMMNQAENYKKLSDEEKEKLKAKILSLQNNPTVIVEPPTPLTKVLDEEVQRWGLQIEEETNRFTDNVKGEYDLIEGRVDNVGLKIDDEFQVFRGDVEREFSNFGDSVSTEFKNFGDSVSMEASNFGDAISTEASNFAGSVKDVAKCLLM